MSDDKGCPFCHALPDEFCVTATGKMRADHKQRERPLRVPGKAEQ